jgi:two-component system, chemotaxis family, chemotaxis protein CheY
MTGILVVDDDVDIRETLGLALELEGYDVALARNGAEGWDCLRRAAPPALVLLDLAMPVLDGPGLLARMRADLLLRRVPVVIITAFGSLAGSVAALAQGFLPKPVDLDHLLAIVAEHCDPAASPSLA